MRSIGFLVLLICLVAPAHALTTANSVISELPDAPAMCCPEDGEVRSDFEDKVRKLQEQLYTEIAERKKVVKEAMNQNSKKMQAAKMDQPGFQGKTQEELKKMSREEKKKMAGQMMQDKYGVSMEEMQKMKKMSKEDRQNSGLAFSAKMQAESAKDPQKAATDQQNNMQTAELAAKQSEVTMRLQATAAKYDAKFKAVEEDPIGRKQFEAIKAAENQLGKMGGDGNSPCKEQVAKAQSINVAKQTYCQMMAPKYSQVVREFSAGMNQILADCDALDQIQAQIQQIQFNVAMPPEQFGLTGLNELRNYIHRLLAVYKYDLPKNSTHQCDGAQ